MSKKLEIVKIVEDERDGTFWLSVKFTDIRGNRREHSFSREILNQPRKFITELTMRGASLPTGKSLKKLLLRLRKAEASAPYIIRAKDVGWRKGGSYVSFIETVLAKNSERDVLAPLPDMTERLGKKGTLGGWKRSVALKAQYSSPMVFSVCAAFAAISLKLIDLNTFGFMLVGPSKTGKSLTQLVAGSVIGFSKEKHLPSFRRTDAALEELTASFNDHLLLINEGELAAGDSEDDRARMLRKFAYRLADGQSKGFSKTVNRPQTFYRTIFIGSMENPSTSCKSISTCASGSHARLFDIPAVRNKGRDVFDRAPKNLSGAARKTWADTQFKSILSGIKDNRGVAYQRFVRSLINDKEAARSYLTRHADRFFHSIIQSDADVLTRHIARHFAHVVAAGLLARKLKILPWSRNRIQKAAMCCLRRAMKSLPSERNAARVALRRLKDAFDNGDIVRFGGASTLKSNLAKASGFYVGQATNCVVTLRVQAFKEWLGSTVALKVLGRLSRAGLIESGRKSKSVSHIRNFSSQVTWPNRNRVRSIVIKWRPKKIKTALR